MGKRKIGLGILIVLAGMFLVFGGVFFHEVVSGIGQRSAQAKRDSAAVILIMDNGDRVNLDEAKTGVLIETAELNVLKTGAGQLAYKLKPGWKEREPRSYHQLIVPRGRTFGLTFMDGSVVSLNAASSLKYPVSFSGLAEREVIFSGEAFFWVKHNSAQSFRVYSKGQIVEDLGTEFGISAYPGDAELKTTLVTGKVKVRTAKGKAVILIPGQQAVVNAAGISLKQIDVERELAWKGDEFNFRDEPLSDIMLELSRWYGIDVAYQDNEVRKETFGGVISRSEHLSKVLQLIELTGGVHFKVKGNLVLVSK